MEKAKRLSMAAARPTGDRTILAIESSCDESAAAVLDARRGLLAHRIFSQVELHRIYGGVVPELASRDHVRRLLPLVRAVLEEAGVLAPGAPEAGSTPEAGGRPEAAGMPEAGSSAASAAHGGTPERDMPRLRPDALHGIAYTAGPGLVGALLTGAALARSLAYAWNIPAIGVHHLEGHLLAARLEPDPPAFPHVALLVSGGHTMLIEVQAIGRYRVLGQTRDDAAGEAFDKSAKLLGLPYPGGPELARLAEAGRPGVFEFPRPMLDRPGLELSFSGLKTAVLHAVRGRDLTPALKADVARAVEEAIVDTLVAKAERALEETGLDTLVVCGGVGANRRLRERLAQALRARGSRACYPRLEFCTDNAAMIAVAGLARLEAGEQDDLGIAARAQWPLESLRPVPA